MICRRRRADVIEYVREKYGGIPSRNRQSARWRQSVVRDVARDGLSYGDCDGCKMIRSTQMSSRSAQAIAGTQAGV